MVLRNPPKIASLLLRFFIEKKANYGFYGDLEEMYNHLANEKSRFRAILWFWMHALKVLPSFIKDSILWRFFMFKNYIKAAFRNMKRYKGYSFINILGLSIGLGCCLLIYLYVRNELSYDKYHMDSDKIYRIVVTKQTPASTRSFAIVSAPVANSLKNDYPQVEKTARILNLGERPIIKYNDLLFRETLLTYVDNELFDILDIPFLEGDPASALDRPDAMVIPESVSKKYFGDESPVGKILRIDGRDDVEITGVVKDSPSNTHMPYGLIRSLKRHETAPWMQDWSWVGFYTYIKLKDNTDVESFKGQIRNLAGNYIGKTLKNSGEKRSYDLQKLTNIYLYSNLEYEWVSGSIQNLYIFSSIGVLILLIACINFTNLTTARSANRAREIGMRKVVGAERGQLISQFLAETVIMAFLSLLIASALAVLALPYFNSITSMDLKINSFIHSSIAIFFIGLLITVGFLAGGYPAFYLSSFKPVRVFKSAVSIGTGGTKLRKILVVGQFAVSIILIISTLIMFQQLKFLKTADLGFEKEKKIYMTVSGWQPLRNIAEPVKERFLKYSSIIKACALNGLPGLNQAGQLETRLSGEQDDKKQTMSYLFFDHDCADLFGIDIVTGRSFSKEISSDLETCLINNSAVKAFGWTDPQEAIGKQIIDGMTRKNLKIIGVTGNFHYRSLRENVEPLIIMMFPDFYNTICLSFSANNFEETLSFVEKTWKELFPEQPFQYNFLDSQYNQLYRQEDNEGKLISTFAILGIFIACMGLLGLSSFTAEQRSKEIGIRKTLGATVPGVVILLSKEYIKLVCTGIVIAVPAAYYFINSWLQDFAYRTELSWIPFVLAAISAFLAAILTVSYQSIRAASADPVKSIREE